MAEEDDLRRVFREFRASVSSEFEAARGRFDRLDGRMDQLEGRMDGLERRMDRLESRMDGLERRMDGLEVRMDSIETQLVELRDEFRSRTRTMETAILNSIRDLGRDMMRRLDDHEERITRLEEG